MAPPCPPAPGLAFVDPPSSPPPPSAFFAAPESGEVEAYEGGGLHPRRVPAIRSARQPREDQAAEQIGEVLDACFVGVLGSVVPGRVVCFV